MAGAAPLCKTPCEVPLNRPDESGDSGNARAIQSCGWP